VRACVRFQRISALSIIGMGTSSVMYPSEEK
jgi:hypothetical protein